MTTQEALLSLDLWVFNIDGQCARLKNERIQFDTGSTHHKFDFYYLEQNRLMAGYRR